MKILSAASVTAALSCAMLLAAGQLSAEPLLRNNHSRVLVHTHRINNRVIVTRPAPIRTVTTVAALGLNSLPAGYVRFVHNDETFYFSDGVYYQKRPKGFVVVKPRAGFRLTRLPSGYTTIREGNVTFYRYNNVRYRKRDGFFIVV